MNVTYFWPPFGLSTMLVGAHIQHGLDLVNDPSLRRRHVRIPHLKAPVPFRLALPGGLTLTDQAFNSYFTRFALYPLVARLQPGDVYHIIDDHNSNLVRALDPRRCVVTFGHAVPEILEREDGVPADSYAMKVFRYSFDSLLRARYVVTATEYARQAILASRPDAAGRVVLNPYGCAEAFFPRPPEQRAPTRAAHGLGENWFVLLNVGGNAPRKNIDAILQALLRLPKEAHFLYVGDGWNEEQSRFIDRHGLRDRVHCKGLEIDDNSLAELYSAADVAVGPALLEGFGMTLLMAMACGLPLITTNFGAMAEVGGDGALLVDTRRPEAIADAVRSLMHNEASRRAWRAAGLRRAQAFSWRRHAERLLELYQEIHAERRPR